MVASWRMLRAPEMMRLKSGGDTVLMKSTISWDLRTVADDIAQAVGGDLRVLVGDIGRQAIDFALQPFDPLQVGDMPGRQAFDDLQDPRVLFGEVVGRRELRQITAMTSSSLMTGTAISLLIRSLMERWNPPRLLHLLDVGDDPGLLCAGGITGQAALVRGEFRRADPERRDVFLQPLLVLGADDGAVSSSTTSQHSPSRSCTMAMLPVSAPISSVALESTLVRNGWRPRCFPGADR